MQGAGLTGGVFRPKKRIFMALTLASVLIGAFLIYVVWKVTVPGLAQINPVLPGVMEAVAVLVVVALLLGVAGIVLALFGMPIQTYIYFWAWKVINIMFPFSVGLGRLFNVPKSRLEQSFIEVSNNLVLRHKVKVPAERVMILLPHCLQLDICEHKITRNIDNCRQCGRCSVGHLVALAKKYGCTIGVATGGTLARQMVKEARPKAIVAVACERDLTSGIQDVFPMPVLGVLNERPFGPCFNTKVDIGKVEEAIKAFTGDGGAA